MSEKKQITVNLINPQDSTSKGILQLDRPDTPIFPLIAIAMLYIVMFSVIGAILNMPYTTTVKIIVLLPIAVVLLLLSIITAMYIKKQNTMIAYYNSLKNKRQESDNS